MLADLGCENTENVLKTNQSGPAADVPDRVINSYIKTSPPRSAPYESDTGTLRNNGRIPESLEKVIPITGSLQFS